MKQSVLKYGLYSAVSLIVLFLIALSAGQSLDYGTREVIGYASIIISLVFVFFGIKHFRDQLNNGLVTFGKALAIGLLITLIASITFGIIDLVYRAINPDFVTEYYDYSVEQLKASVPADQLDAKLEEMESQREMFANPLMSFVFMALTVFVLGFIISLISALVLQRK